MSHDDAAAIHAAMEHHRAGRLAEAERVYRRVLATNSNDPQALHLLGLIGLQVGRVDDALRLIERAMALRPDYTEARANLTRAYFQLGRSAEASGRLHEAAAHYRRATELQPTFAEAHFNLGAALSAGADATEIIPHITEAARLAPGLAVAHEKLLHLHHFVPGDDRRANFERHRAWAARFAEPLTAAAAATRPHPNPRDAGRRLRVGYVSPDLRRHSVAYFLEPLLAAHDRSQVEVTCYADEIKRDATTDRLRRHADHWRAITGQDDEAVAALVRSDAVDILVDLAGQLEHNRLLVFARRPAPVQVTYLGYPDTTGMSAMDYRLTDALADPPGDADPFHTERLVRLPTCAWCYRPDDQSPPPDRAGGSVAGPVTFGCFNASMKINPPLIAMWARLLREIPDARLVIKDGLGAPSPAHPRIRREFDRHGISSDRIELLSYVPSVAEHLGLYRRIDVALDTFAYHGTATTCEALYMGVPVVTLRGDRHLSRVGASLLNAAGFGELVADTVDEYVAIAVRVAGERRDRAAVRAQMQASALMDAGRFARDVEAAYRRMWASWCDQARG